MPRDSKLDKIFLVISLLILMGSFLWQTQLVKRDPNFFYRMVGNVKRTAFGSLLGSIEGGRKYIYAIAATKDEQLIATSKIQDLKIYSGGYLLRWDVTQDKDVSRKITGFLYGKQASAENQPEIRAIATDEVDRILINDGWGQAMLSGYGFLPIAISMGVIMSFMCCFGSNNRKFALVIPFLCIFLVGIGRSQIKEPTQASEVWSKSQVIQLNGTK